MAREGVDGERIPNDLGTLCSLETHLECLAIHVAEEQRLVACGLFEEGDRFGFTLETDGESECEQGGTFCWLCWEECM